MPSARAAGRRRPAGRRAEGTGAAAGPGRQGGVHRPRAARQVQRYYDLVDVLAYPRHSMRLTELVTPLKPLEAMAQGRLLVASDVGGHRELIRHGETGWLFPAGSAPTHWPTLLDRRAGRRERLAAPPCLPTAGTSSRPNATGHARPNYQAPTRRWCRGGTARDDGLRTPHPGRPAAAAGRRHGQPDTAARRAARAAKAVSRWCRPTHPTARNGWAHAGAARRLPAAALPVALWRPWPQRPGPRDGQLRLVVAPVRRAGASGWPGCAACRWSSTTAAARRGEFPGALAGCGAAASMRRAAR
jgi:hypothetical protein